MRSTTSSTTVAARIGRALRQLALRLLLILCVLLGLTAAAPATSRARATQPASSPSSSLSADGADYAAPVGAGAAASQTGQASGDYTGNHTLRLHELERLIHSPQGRSLLRSSLGVAVLRALERSYGVSPSSPIVPPLDPAARPSRPTIPAYHPAQHVGPLLALQATSVPADARMSLTGARFAPGETVTLLLDGHAVGTLTATARGTLPRGLAVALPASVAAGAHVLTAVGSRSPEWATAMLRVYGVTASLQRTTPGGAILFRGRGFAPGQIMRFTLRQGSGRAVLLGLGGTDSEGTLVPLLLFVPPAARAGRDSIVVRDDAGEAVSLPLTLVAPARHQRISVYRLAAHHHAPAAHRATPRAHHHTTHAVARHNGSNGTRVHSATPLIVGPARGTGAVGVAGGQAPFGARLAALLAVPSAASDARQPIARRATTTRAGPVSAEARGLPQAPAALPADNCYTGNAGGFTFTSVNCPVSNTGSMSNTATVTDVAVSAPITLGVQTPITLPSITVDSNQNPVLPITLPTFNFTKAGFSVSAISSTVAMTGLNVISASLTLPSQFGGLGLTASNVSIGTDGSVSGSVALTPYTQTITYAGFSLTLAGISLDQNGVSVAQVILAVPADILPSIVPAGVPTSLTVNNVRLTFDGGFSVGSVTPAGRAHARPAIPTSLPLPPFKGVYGGFLVNFGGGSLGLNGLTVNNAALGIPQSVLPSNVSPITVTGALTITRAAGQTTAINGLLSVGPVTIGLAGFTINTGSITLSNAGLTVNNAQLSLPASLFPAGSTPPVLTGNLSITPAFTITGSLSTGPFSIPLAGFTVSADGITLSTDQGLVVSNAKLTLPASLLPAGSSAIALTGNLTIDPQFNVTASLASGPISITLAGFNVAVDNITFSNTSGLAIVNARLSLPASLFPAGSTLPVLTGNLTVLPSFTVTGQLATGTFSIPFAGFTIAADGITLSTGTGLVVSNARLALSASLFPAGSTPPVLTGNLTISPQFAVSAMLSTGPFSIPVAGFTVSADGITLSNGGLVVSNARLTLPASLFPAGSTPPVLTGNLSIDPNFNVTASLTTGAFSLTVAGFAVAVDNISLTTGSGLVLTNARLSLPASLFPANSKLPVLTGNLTVTPALAVTGSLTTGAFSIPVGGFTISSDGITLSNAGLVVSNARLTLPANLFPAGSTPPVLTGNLTIDPKFNVAASLTTGPFSLTVAGFAIATDGISLSNANGLVVSNARLTLPASFLPANSSPVTLVGNLSIDPNFNVTASLSVSDVNIAYAGVKLHVDSIVLNNNGLAATNATATLPSDLGGGTLIGNLTVSSSFAINGSLALQRPNFTFHGLTVSAESISLSLSVGGTTNAVFAISNARVTLPSDLGTLPLVGNLTASIGSGGTRIVGQLSTTNAHFSFQGFTVEVGAITLDNNGIRASGLSLTLPSRFNVNGQPVVLTGALGLDVSGGHTTFTGSLGAQNIRIAAFGFTLTVASITVGTDGLSVQNATLTLPQALANLLKTNSVTLASLTITRDYQVSARVNPLSFSLAGASISTGPLDLGTNGISAPGASVTLPAALGGRTFTMPNLNLSPSGDASGDTGAPSSGKCFGFNVNVLSAQACGFGFKNGGIFIASVSASIPVIQGSFTLNGISFDGHHFGIQGGTVSLALPPINAGGFTISAQATLTFSDLNGSFSFDLVGSGTIDIPSLGQFHCALEIGSTDFNHPFPLRMAEIDVQLHVGIPLGVGPFQSGLELNAISGGIRIGRNTSNGNVLVSLNLGLGIGTDDGGYLFEGNVNGAIATDGNFGLGGGGAFLANLIQISGGFSARFSAQNDGVCGVVMRTNGARIDAGGGTGFYAEVTFGKTFHVRKDITVQASAYAHIWKDSDGAELSASVGATIDVPSGSLFALIPPKGLHFDAGATLGKFRKGGQTYRGIKLSITYHFFGKDHTYSVFVDSNGNAHVGANDYTVIDAGNNIGYLLASLPNGATMARRLTTHALAAPLRGREMETSLRILPGQSNGVFTLYWHRGAPRLTLIAPNGARYSQDDPRVAQIVTGRRDLTDGYSGAATIIPAVLTSGAWTVRIDNLRGDEGYKLSVQAANPRPRLTVTAPAGGQTAVANPFVTVRGALSGPTTANSVSLYYTTARTVEVKGPDGHLSTVPNLGGAALAEGVPVRNGTFSYRWNTAAFPRGVYYVYAVLDNGFDAEVATYARGRVLVMQPSAPQAPRNVVATRRGTQLHILWTPPTHSSILAGYKLHWRTNDMPAGQYHVLDLGNVHSFDLGESRAGMRYEAAVTSYDLSNNQSALAPAREVANTRGGAAFRASTPGGTTRAGGNISIPLTLTPLGRATGRAPDYATLSVGPLPMGVTVAPTVEEPNIFARFDQSDPAAPTLQVQTSPFASPTAPGQPVIIPVTLRQEGTGRSVTVNVRLTIRAGAPAQFNMWYGTPTRRPDGLLSVPVVAKVVDASGSGASEGTAVTFSAVDGVVKRSDVTTVATTPNCVTMPTALCGPTASIKGGFAATTLVYAPGTHPYVIGDTGTAVGSLYVGATPRGASRSRYFAITESKEARQRRAHDGLRISNTLNAEAHVRVDYWTLQPGDFPRERIAIVPLSPHSSIVFPLDPAGTGAQHLPAREAPRGLSLGVHVISDLPVVSEEVVSGLATGGASRVIAARLGVNEEGIRDQWTFRLPANHAVIDLYTGRTRPVAVTVTGSNGRASVTQSLRLVPHGSGRVDLTALFAARHVHPRGTIVVTVRANKAFAAEPEL